METYKPQPLKERQSQKVNFWDFTKEKLFWGALPFLTAGAAMLVGKFSNFSRKVWPLDGSTDIVSYLWAKGMKAFAKKENIKGAQEVGEWINKGALVGELIDEFSGSKDTADRLRKYYFNFLKGAEVATPFSVYFLWHKKEGNRLDLEEAGNKLKHLQTLKPSDAELATHNEAMRRQLEFAAANAGDVPAATIDKAGAEYHGKLETLQKQRM